MGGIIEVLKQKSPEEEKAYQRLLSEQMGDIEFQMELAPYTNYTQAPDPSVARYRGIKGLSGDTQLTLGGYYIPPPPEGVIYSADQLAPEKGRADGIDFTLPNEVGTVNAVHSGSKPNIWAHEYRHKSQPDFTEKDNRLADAGLSQTHDQWNESVDMWRDQLLRQGHKVSLAEAEEDLIRKLVWDEDRFGKDVMGRLYAKEMESGGNIPESKQTLLRSDEADYRKMREEQAYWKKRQEDTGVGSWWKEKSHGYKEGGRVRLY